MAATRLAAMSYRRDDSFIRELSDDLIVVETNQRIIQEVSVCKDWVEVEDVLHRYHDYYFRLVPRVRAYLNERIKDVMSGRGGA
jgi:hypothetical protein